MLTPQTDYQELAKDALFDSLKLIFSMTEAQANKMFRFSWPTETGSERFTAKPTTDVCYIRFTPIALSGTGYINSSVYAEGLVSSERMDTHRGVRAQLIFYGPHSAEYATRARVGFDRCEAADVLRPANMSFVPNKELPTSLDELIDGNWYSRTDVNLDFYQLIVYTGTVPTIEIAPEIHLVKNE